MEKIKDKNDWGNLNLKEDNSKKDNNFDKVSNEIQNLNEQIEKLVSQTREDTLNAIDWNNSVTVEANNNWKTNVTIKNKSDANSQTQTISHDLKRWNTSYNYTWEKDLWNSVTEINKFWLSKWNDIFSLNYWKQNKNDWNISTKNISVQKNWEDFWVSFLNSDRWKWTEKTLQASLWNQNWQIVWSLNILNNDWENKNSIFIDKWKNSRKVAISSQNDKWYFNISNSQNKKWNETKLWFWNDKSNTKIVYNKNNFWNEISLNHTTKNWDRENSFDWKINSSWDWKIFLTQNVDNDSFSRQRRIWVEKDDSWKNIYTFSQNQKNNDTWKVMRVWGSFQDGENNSFWVQFWYDSWEKSNIFSVNRKVVDGKETNSFWYDKQNGDKKISLNAKSDWTQITKVNVSWWTKFPVNWNNINDVDLNGKVSYDINKWIEYRAWSDFSWKNFNLWLDWVYRENFNWSDTFELRASLEKTFENWKISTVVLYDNVKWTSFNIGWTYDINKFSKFMATAWKDSNWNYNVWVWVTFFWK